MSLSDSETKEEVVQELDLLDQQIQNDQRDDRRKILLSWATSLSIHVVIFLIACTIAFGVIKDKDMDLPPIRITSISSPDKKIDDTIKHRELLDNKVIIESDIDDKNPVNSPIVTLDETNMLPSTEDDTLVPNDTIKGREEAISDKEMGSTGFTASIGVGSNSSGLYGNRTGANRHRISAKMGPHGRASEAATEASLRWLKKHQSPNGEWSATKYYLNCTDQIKCEPGGEAGGNVDVAMTGYALLCYLGAGYDHKTPNKYRNVVKNGLEYLLSIQKNDGALGERNYEQAVATMALAEAYGMSNDPALREPTQKGVDFLISHQTFEKDADPYSGLLWDYVSPNINRADNSVNGWVLMCLKSSVASGLNVKNSLDGAKKAIERVWKAANPNWEKLTDPYKDKSIFPYTWNATTNATDKDHLSFVGATCSVFLGRRSGDIMLETLMNDTMDRWITSDKYKTNNYAAYYTVMSAFQMGGDRWKTILNIVIPHILETQRVSEDCFNGSWDYQNQQWAGSNVGRVLTTCYNTLNLEVAYRYAQVHPEVKIRKK